MERCAIQDPEHRRSDRIGFLRIHKLPPQMKANVIRDHRLLYRRSSICSHAEKLQAIVSIPAPTNVFDLRSCLGVVNFYERLVRNIQELRHPLDKLLKNDAVEFRLSTVSDLRKLFSLICC